MATIAHLAAGLALGRVHLADRKDTLRTLAVFGPLGVLPDLDLAGRALGIAFDTPLGHRGAMHSLGFAAAVGILAALLARRLGWGRLRTGVLAAAAVASHGVLDAISGGRLGIAFLWPFTDARFLASYRLVPAALPALFSLEPRGFAALLLEAAIFAPLAAYALWPRRRPAPDRLRWLGGSPEAAQRLRAWRASIEAQVTPERDPLG